MPVEIGQLEQARKQGDLAGQAAALAGLIKIGQNDLQTTLDKVTQAQSLNQKAQSLLSEQPLEALTVAIESDTLVYNEQARTVIKSVLNPYLDFINLHVGLRNWSRLPFETLIVSDNLSPDLQVWYQAFKRPHLWPQNELFKYINEKKSLVIRGRAMTMVAGEYQKFVELLLTARRLAEKLPNDGMMPLLFEDTKKISHLYNTLLADMSHHFLQFGLGYLQEANRKIIADANAELANPGQFGPWQTHYQGIITGFLTDVQHCCQANIKVLASQYPHFHEPDNFASEVQKQLAGFDELRQANFITPASAQQAKTHAEKQNELLSNALISMRKLSDSVDRRTVVEGYLQSMSAWQNNDFYGLEVLMPHLRQYRSILKGF